MLGPRHRTTAHATPQSAMKNPLSIVLLAMIFILAGCGAAADPPAEPSPVPRVEVATATARTQALPIRTSGRLASKAEIPLSFKIDGVIDRILVDEGEAVREGRDGSYR